MERANIPARPLPGFPVAARLAGWLEERITAMAARRAARDQVLNTRTVLRWLALHWAKVVAWWLTLGLGLTLLLLVAALLTWQNPQALLSGVMGALQGLLTHGTPVGVRLGLVVLILCLPVLLPGALLSAIVIVTLVLGAALLGPLLMAAVMAFGVLFALALFKRSKDWTVDFMVRALADSDQNERMRSGILAALGLTRSSTTMVEGQARWLEGDELARYVAANKTAKRGAPVFLGKVNGAPFVVWTEKHVYLTASSRSGKGRDLIIPNLKMYPESVFVLDPKGENCETTAALREQKGHRIAVFDPDKLTSRPSASFNPLAGLTTKEDMINGADYLAEALVIGESDHWNESARGLIRAVMLHIMTCPQEQLKHRARDLPCLRELLSGALDATLTDMAESEALDGLVSRLAETMRDLSPNERSGVVSTARRATKWLDNPNLAGLFKQGPECITFEDFRDPTKKLSVFVCLKPLTFGTYPEICRLLTTFALDTMMSRLTGRKRPVVFILDELAQLQRLPIVERAFTLGAGYGVQMWSVFQSVGQARKLYPIDTLYGSSGIRCFFKIEDPESAEFASKAAAGVLKPADVQHLPELAMLTLLEGTNPLLVERLGPTGAARAA